MQATQKAEEQHAFGIRKGLITAPSIFTAEMLANHTLPLLSYPTALLKLYCPGNRGWMVKRASFQLIVLLGAPIKVSVKCNTETIYDQAVTPGEAQKGKYGQVSEKLKIKQMAG